MQLSFNFSILLVILYASSSLSAPNNVKRNPAAEALPEAVATMPITSLHRKRDDFHPSIFMQLHVNRATRRLARMSGRPEPRLEDLAHALQKRIDGVHQGYAAGLHSHSKRYVITDSRLGGAVAGSKVAAVEDLDTSFTGRFRPANRKAANRQQAGQGTPTSSSSEPSVTVVAGGGTNTTSGTSSSTEVGQGQTGSNNGAGEQQAAGAAAASNSTAQGANSNSQGVSPIDIQAAQNGGLTNANTPTAKQSLGLNIEANDVGYIADVQMGTPPRAFKILMDSGSADLWVGSEVCTSQAGGGCGNHQFLGTQSSSSFAASNQNFKITYGTGNVAGTIVKDNVNLAGLDLNAHTFGVATSESVDFSSNQTPFDGLMGLAKSNLSQQQTLTPPESLAQQGAIQQAIVAYKISRLSDQKNDGEISFGGVDSTKFDQASLVTIDNVNPQGFWEAPMVATVNGKSVGLDTGRTAILDTGTTLIIAPSQDAATIHQNIQGAKQDQQNGFTVPCTMSEVITMQFGGQNFDINPSDMAIVPLQANNPTGDCVSGIQAGQIGGAQEWLVGDVFLKNAYFVTNVNTNQLSLAKLK